MPIIDIVYLSLCALCGGCILAMRHFGLPNPATEVEEFVSKVGLGLGTFVMIVSTAAIAKLLFG